MQTIKREFYVIIGAAGRGMRMAAPMPKQFMNIGGKTILERTAETFLAMEETRAVVIVTATDYIAMTEALFPAALQTGRVQIVLGGDYRQDSVYEGLKALRRMGAADDSIVLIHDGVRPYVDRDLICRVAEAAAKTGAAIPAVAPKDTIRHRDGGTLDRSELCCVQTPQGFRMNLIEDAFAQAFSEGFYGTDDGSLAERAGYSVAVVEGEYANIKITTPEDLQMEMRIGTGFDVHQLVEDRKLVLGGVTVPYEKGLLGHSDADVLVHALMDAMLGAAALGDIGKLFPDSDPAYQGISSILLLEKVHHRISEAGYSLGNADVTVICQRPKLAPYIEKMRENIAAALEAPIDKISIKATTTEKLGFTGRGEGIAVEAVCLLRR